MSLQSILRSASEPSKTVTIYGPELDSQLRSFFSQFAVEVQHESFPVAAADAFVVLTDDGQFLSSVDVGAVERLAGSADRAPWEGGGGTSARALLEMLDGTTFTLTKRRHLLAVSRQIEERAWRIGRGTVHAGFQRLAAFESQLPIYERLAAERDLSVHVYGLPDWPIPSETPVNVHAETAEEIGRFWFVAFVDDGDYGGLIAEQRNSDYDGLWTFDSDTVSDLVDYLTATYG